MRTGIISHDYTAILCGELPRWARESHKLFVKRSTRFSATIYFFELIFCVKIEIGGYTSLSTFVDKNKNIIVYFA